MSAILEARGIRKTYRGGDNNPVEVLTGVDLSIYRGQVVAIIGASGAGKSTLLHLLGALDEPTGGEIALDGTSYSRLGEEERGTLRNRQIGFVFQFHHLLREFTALENVMMPLLIAGWAEQRARGRAEEVLAAVDLAGRMSHRPAELSGGEQQRCAVARALVHDPKVLLADEPTGNLDFHNSARVHDLLLNLARSFEAAMVVATHNRALAERADRVFLLEGGRLQPTDTSQVVL
jgi:lipoprotein-releasing system ATP-binding protein